MTKDLKMTEGSPPGSLWRFRTYSTDETLEMENRGVFDELVVDEWLHIEQMDTATWSVRLGKIGIFAEVLPSGDVEAMLTGYHTFCVLDEFDSSNHNSYIDPSLTTLGRIIHSIHDSHSSRLILRRDNSLELAVHVSRGRYMVVSRTSSETRALAGGSKSAEVVEFFRLGKSFPVSERYLVSRDAALGALNSYVSGEGVVNTGTSWEREPSPG